MDKVKALQDIATKLRIHCINMTSKAGSGHPSTCFSMAELMSCLFFDEMSYDVDNPNNLANDEFVLSKGHAAPILWACFSEAGIIMPQAMDTLRKINSSVEGHPTPRMKFVKAATGSLGQGLSVGVGMCLANNLAKSKARVYVMLGDGELAEGNIWEAANSAAFYELDNLVAVVDVNRLGQSMPTMHEHDLDAYVNKFEAFGWEAIKIDGHKIDKILDAFAKARKSKKPVAIIAKTFKGKDVSFLEDKEGWHGKALDSEKTAKALKELGPIPEVNSAELVKEPKHEVELKFKQSKVFKVNYKKDDEVATRAAFGNALVSLGKSNEAIVALDGDVKNSTMTEDFFKAYPKRSFDSFIAEQNMVGMSIGFSSKGFIPVPATFAAFLTRAHDQIRMAAYSYSNITFVGSHVGVSIGEDGASQMGLEDMAMFTPIPQAVVLYPSDAVSAEYCTKLLVEHKGISYLRTTRPATPIIYKNDESFKIGGSKIIKKSKDDKLTVIAAGITVHEALKAYKILKKEGINIRIIDAYSVKPIDEKGILASASETNNKLIVVEDHFQFGGLGETVRTAVGDKAKIKHLFINDLPRSGKPDELLDLFCISADSIVKAVKK